MPLGLFDAVGSVMAMGSEPETDAGGLPPSDMSSRSKALGRFDKGNININSDGSMKWVLFGCGVLLFLLVLKRS